MGVSGYRGMPSRNALYGRISSPSDFVPKTVDTKNTKTKQKQMKSLRAVGIIMINIIRDIVKKESCVLTRDLIFAFFMPFYDVLRHRLLHIHDPLILDL